MYTESSIHLRLVLSTVLAVLRVPRIPVPMIGFWFGSPFWIQWVPSLGPAGSSAEGSIRPA